MPWIYLAAAAGVVVLLRLVLGVVTAAERASVRREEARVNRELRERLARFTR